MSEYYLEPPNHAQRWRGVELSDEDKTKALENAMEMAAQAQVEYDEGRYHYLCVMGEPVFYFDYPHALIPGHVYSESGMDEYKISGSCEYHFDKWFKEEDE